MSWRQALKQHNPFMLRFCLVSKTSYGFTCVSSFSLRVTDCCVISQDMLVFFQLLSCTNFFSLILNVLPARV